MSKKITYCPVYFIYSNYDCDTNINFSENHNFGFVERLIKYVLNPEKTKRYLFGTSGIAETYIPQRLALQFYAIQAAFDKTDARKIVHMTVLFRPETCIDDFMAADIGQRIADYIGLEFQTIFAVHTNSENIHIHFIINSVSYRDGSLYKTTTTNLKRYYEIINQMYGEIYHVESIGGYGYCIEK